jgi:nitric oxide reductase large subunit
MADNEVIPSPATNNINEQSGFMTRVKNSFKRHTLWWIIGIIAIVIVIGLVIWGIVALVNHNKTETFIPFDPQSTDSHKGLNIKPETSYLESYISSALAIN